MRRIERFIVISRKQNVTSKDYTIDYTFLCLNQEDFDYDGIRDDLAETDTQLRFSTE